MKFSALPFVIGLALHQCHQANAQNTTAAPSGVPAPTAAGTAATGTAATGTPPIVAAAVPLEVKPGIAISIRYILQKPGRVSLNIYDGKGAVVRELLHVASRPAGENLDVWDGLDNAGKPVTPGKYGWKLLSTPGLKAEYLMSLGSSYPVQAESLQKAEWNDGAPGTHVGPRAVFADETGIYVGASTETIEPALVKISRDGSKKLWNLFPGYGHFPLAIAKTGGDLWMLGRDGLISSYNPETGARRMDAVRTFIGLDIDGKLDGEKAADMSAGDGHVVVCWTKKGLVRWVDAATRQKVLDVPLPNATNVAADSKGNVYVAADKAIYKVRRAAPEPALLVDGLDGIRNLTVDETNGDILVVQCPSIYGRATIKRFSSAGKLLRTWGEGTIERFGLYTREVQETSFYSTNDIAATPEGGFVICEPYVAPRRTAVFDKNGKFEREWYGGQIWGPWIVPEPDNPNIVWMASTFGEFMRCEVDYKNKTWKVLSTWPYVMNEAFGPTGLDHRIEIRKRNGQLYLIHDGSIMLLDQKSGTLKPVACLFPRTGHYVNTAPHIVAPLLSRLAKSGKYGPATRLGDALWTDDNGDGKATEEEVKWLPSTGWGSGPYFDDDLTIYFLEQGKLMQRKAASWNAFGAPVYETGPLKPVGTAQLPPRERGGSGFLTRDPKTGEFYSFTNYFAAWATSKDSFLVKMKADGSHLWTVGKIGSAPGQIRYFRRAFGMVKDCVTAANTSNEFPNEGVAKTYVWDKDGLFVGGLLNNPNLDGINFGRYGLGAESLSGVIYEHPVTGEVLLFAHWVNEGRIFRITGWDGWERLSGDTEIQGEAGTGGNGILASFLEPDGTQVGQWISQNAAFEPGQLKSQTAKQVAQSGQYLVRMTGTIAAPADGEYVFTTNGGGNVHLVVGNYVAIDTIDGKTAPAPVPMKASQRVAFQLEYSPAGKDAGVRLSWGVVGGQSVPVPATALFAANDEQQSPFGHGTGLSAKYYQAWLPRAGMGPGEKLPAPKITRIDPVIDMKWNKRNEPENSPFGNPQYVVHWKGYILARNSGFHFLRADPYGPGQLRFNNEEKRGTSTWAWLEAGKKYPIEVYYTSFSFGHLKPREQHELRLQMATPYHGFQTIPQSQLFPAAE